MPIGKSRIYLAREHDSIDRSMPGADSPGSICAGYSRFRRLQRPNFEIFFLKLVPVEREPK
jgi:hypothetical protein